MALRRGFAIALAAHGCRDCPEGKNDDGASETTRIRVRNGHLHLLRRPPGAMEEGFLRLRNHVGIAELSSGLF